MKKIMMIFTMLFSFQVLSAGTITDNFTVTKISFNQEKKYYEISLSLMAAVYKADEKVIHCLQKSLDNKKKAKITFGAMDSKILSCEI